MKKIAETLNHVKNTNKVTEGNYEIEKPKRQNVQKSEKKQQRYKIFILKMHSCRMAAPILYKIEEKIYTSKRLCEKKNIKKAPSQNSQKNTYAALKLLLGAIQVMFFFFIE